ncbi:MAG: DUF4810 domain-containing protein [Bacteroidaceae bacterium]
MKKHKIGFLISTLLVLITLSSCATQTNLYSWANYSDDVYTYYKKQTPASLENLTKTYQNLLEHQRGTRGVTPPGTYVEYGYLLCLQGQKQEGMEMINKEKELYPESTTFVDRILSSLNK